MNKESKILFTLIVTTVLIIGGTMVENIQMAKAPQQTEVKTNINKVKQKLLDAGLNPREAMHWKAL